MARPALLCALASLLCALAAARGAAAAAEQSVLLLKPDLVQRGINSLAAVKRFHKRYVEPEGFQLVGLKEVTLDKDAVDTLYHDIREGLEIDMYQVREYLTSAPSWALLLEKDNAVRDLVALTGNEDPQQARQDGRWGGKITLRQRLGKSLVHNSFHCSVDRDAALDEIDALFPDGGELGAEGHEL